MLASNVTNKKGMKKPFFQFCNFYVVTTIHTLFILYFKILVCYSTIVIYIDIETEKFISTIIEYYDGKLLVNLEVYR